MIEDVFGYIGCVFLVITLIPQLTRTYKTKKADDISPFFVVLALCTTCIYLTYGILIDETPIVTANSILLFQNFLLLYFKYKYRNKKKGNFEENNIKITLV